MRPETARSVLGSETAGPCPETAVRLDRDPGWSLARSTEGAEFDPLVCVARSEWWSNDGPEGWREAVESHWRHAVAVSQAARREAIRGRDPDPDAVARAGLLHGLGRWFLAAEDPERWVLWWRCADPVRRRSLEGGPEGPDLVTIGLARAEALGVETLVRDAIWLHDRPERGLERLTDQPERLRWIQRAYRLAERTPWAVEPAPDGLPRPRDVEVHALMAETQVACGSGLLSDDATSREERWVRVCARERIRHRDELAEIRAGREAALNELHRLKQHRNRLVDTVRNPEPIADPVPDRSRLEALAEFAAGAAHEINNPMAVIVGRAQLLMARESDPSALRALRAILGQAQRANRMIRDLMFVARPPALRPRAIHPEDVLAHCVDDLKSEAQTRGVRLTLKLPASDRRRPAWADPEALRHIADALIRNALEATPNAGAVRVVVLDDPDRIGFDVHDTGRGLSDEESIHLFDPFYCGRQAGRGLGLGLPRARRIVEQAGGILEWRRRSDRGATFRVRLPRIVPPAPDLATPADPLAGQGRPAA